MLEWLLRLNQCVTLCQRTVKRPCEECLSADWWWEHLECVLFIQSISHSLSHSNFNMELQNTCLQVEQSFIQLCFVELLWYIHWCSAPLQSSLTTSSIVSSSDTIIVIIYTDKTPAWINSLTCHFYKQASQIWH